MNNISKRQNDQGAEFDYRDVISFTHCTVRDKCVEVLYISSEWYHLIVKSMIHCIFKERFLIEIT